MRALFATSFSQRFMSIRQLLIVRKLKLYDSEYSELTNDQKPTLIRLKGDYEHKMTLEIWMWRVAFGTMP